MKVLFVKDKEENLWLFNADNAKIRMKKFKEKSNIECYTKSNIPIHKEDKNDLNTNE